MKLLLILVLMAAFESSAQANLVCRLAFANSPTIEHVAEGISRLSAEDQLYFIMADESPTDQLVTTDDMFGYKQYLVDSYSHPVPFFNKENPKFGGIGAFEGNIFPEGYWRQHGVSRREAQRNQPWLKWDSQTKRFSIERGNTAATLLARYVRNGKVKLYRGADERGLRLLERIKEGDRSELTEDTFGYTDALFFTPERSYAEETWGKGGGRNTGGYVEIELSVEQFNQIYAGIEFRFVEVALSPGALLSAIDTLIVHRN